MTSDTLQLPSSSVVRMEESLCESKGLTISPGFTEFQKLHTFGQSCFLMLYFGGNMAVGKSWFVYMMMLIHEKAQSH